MLSTNNHDEMETDEKTIEEEYKIWRTNCPFLYDRVHSEVTTWPYLSAQWLPGLSGGKERLLLGTQTSDEEPNYLEIAEVSVPYVKAKSSLDTTKEDMNRPAGSVKIVQQFRHDGDVNRARYMPQNPSIVATHGQDSSLFLFDISKPAPDSDGSTNDSILELTGHDDEGYALAWNPLKQGYLLSGAKDNVVCMWDVGGSPAGRGDGETLGAIREFKGHADMVEDVAWDPAKETLFGSVGDDNKLMIWDTRERNSSKPMHSVTAHDDAVNCLAFNPFRDFILLTGSSDKNIALWDLRNLSEKLHTFSMHQDAVYNLQWHPQQESVFMSGSTDRRVNVWDLARIGDEQTSDDADDGPPELLFVHGGHTAPIQDLSWSVETPWLACSVAENNILQCWQMATHIFKDEEPDVEARDLE